MSKHDLDIYLDESGASGRNYLENNPSPYFVMAGFIARRTDLDKLRKVITDWESKHLKNGQKRD